MAARLPSLELADPFGGLADLRDKVLRTPGRPQDSFTDDPLRMLRAARFTAQLGFTVTAGRARGDDGARPPAGRGVRRTDQGRAHQAHARTGPDGPVRGIALLVDTGVADQVLPEVPRLRLEVDEHFRHKDVYQHSLTVLEQAIALEARYGLEADLGSGWPRCCTTSASRRPAACCRTAGWRSTITRWWAPRWPGPGSASCASPRTW